MSAMSDSAQNGSYWDRFSVIIAPAQTARRNGRNVTKWRLFFDHSQIIQSECLRWGSWGPNMIHRETRSNAAG